MASGGGLPRSRQSSEGKKRSTWQNQRSSFSDRDDALSLNSLPSDVRINNWDFSDWRPNSSSVDAKRKKKSKGNPEREREQSLSLDSPPGEERKKHTPSTYPRTKVTPSTPPAQRVALENLRTHMTFSDFDDQASTDGEPNNERDLAGRRRQQRALARPGAGGGAEAMAQFNIAEPREERSTRNNFREDTPDKGPDSNQIVARLMQIRDYIKQAMSMQESLQNMGDTTKREDLAKVKALIGNLREQERGYLGLLQRTLHQGGGGGGEGAGNAPMGGRGETDSDSLDLEVQSNASASSGSTSSRPRIEDKLGLEMDEEGTSRESRQSDTLDNTLVAAHSALAAAQDPDDQSLEENDAVSVHDDQDELEALRQHQSLLQILIEKQKQLKVLQERQNFLLAKQKDAERRLAEARDRDNQARAALEAAEVMTEGVANGGMVTAGPLKSNIVGYPESDDDESANARAPDNLPPELLEMHNHLSYLRNELRHEEPERDTAPNNAESEAASRDVLRDKLQALQLKKGRMDELLKELQILQSKRLELLTNETEAEPSGASAALPQPAEPTAVDREEEEEEEEEDDEKDAEALNELMDAQEKLRKLQEVRERLNQLRDLVQYYQRAKEGEGEEAQPSPAQLAAWQNAMQSQGGARGFEGTEQGAHKFPMQESSDNNNAVSILRRPRPPPESQQSEENASEAGTNADSQLSSLGPWGDDPELQDKVRKLMTAKERLRQLQELVNLVQQSPEAVNSLPADLAQLAASLEDESIDDSNQPLPEEPNISVSEGEVPVARPSEEPRVADGGAMDRERQELESLRQERRRLLAIQDQLKNLQDQFTKEENISESDEQNDTAEKVSTERGRQTQNAPVVTFASNDELYSKMRKQRILREELRQKKKELEAIMKKDRNKRQYFRNQDNQSDTVSYSTDAYGASASADATMATWGGSTVDNLENITEYDDRNTQGEDHDDDDGYPSDGIVQVEEEEEENQSDNGTYTIEQDARQRRSAREQRGLGQGARPKLLRKSQSFPQPLRETQPKQTRSRRTRKPAPPPPLPQQQAREAAAAEKERKEELPPNQALQHSLEQTAQMCRTLLQQCFSGRPPALGGYEGDILARESMVPDPLSREGLMMREGLMSREGLPLPMSPERFLMQQQQLQQQQLALSMNQCYQQLSLQQMEMRSLQAQIHQLSMQLAATQGEGAVTPLGPLPPHVAPSSTAASFNVQTSRQAVFTLNPQFPYPDPFSGETTGHSGLFNLAGVEEEGAEGGHRPQPHHGAQRGVRQPGEVGQRERNRDPSSSLHSSRSSEQRRWGSLQNPHVAGIDQRRMTTPADSDQGRGSGGAVGGSRTQTLTTHAVRNPRSPPRNQESALDSFAGSEMSLFDMLRETIYAEVATLISQNESRPQFLIELFRELQLLKTDQTRQSFLSTLQDLRSKSSQERLAHAQTREGQEQRPAWLAAGAEQITGSEVTPSESLMTSDDEMFYRGSRERRRRGRRPMSGEAVPQGSFDYVEMAEQTSSLSTPSGIWESPFNQDSLGDTVVHFDKELQKMREYEQRKEEQRQRVAQARRALPEVSSSSAMAQDSESSIPDADYSRIDLLQLDQLIKSIVAQVLPVIRQHIDDVCTPQVLAYIQGIILRRTRESNEEQEFSQFFQRAMKAIVQDILDKYEGRRMRDVKDELVMDLSEVLFNELAFFRLMQNLDPPSLADKVRARARIRNSGGEERAPIYRQQEPEGEEEEETDGNESSSEQSSESEATRPARLTMMANEEDDLGKERDDELANDTTVREADDKDDDADRPYSGAVSIHLAVSETKPFTRIGSDEDDDDEDNSQSVEDPSETAVSRDAWRERSGPVGAPAEASSLEAVTMETRGSQGAAHESGEEEEDLTPRNSQPHSTGEQQEADGTAVNSDKPSAAASPDKPCLTNGTASGAQNGSQANGPVVNGEAEEELTLDDLPSALNIPAPAGVEEKAREEQGAVTGVEGILLTMDTGNELAGDPLALPNPDSFANQAMTEQ